MPPEADAFLTDPIELAKQAKMLILLRNVLLASIREIEYAPLVPEIFTKPPFPFLGCRTKPEALFGGKNKLAGIL